MGLHFNSEDLIRLESTSRAMVSPLAAPSVEAWRNEVNRAMRELFSGQHAIFMLPDARVLYTSEDSPELLPALAEYGKLAADGHHTVKDPLGERWHLMRLQEQKEVFSWDINEEMLGRLGHRMKDSQFVEDVLTANGVREFLMIHTQAPAIEAMVWVLSKKKEFHRFGDHAASLLQALLPSFKAGLHVLANIRTQQLALDELSEAITIIGGDRRELYRNAALRRMLEDEPMREHVISECRRLVHIFHPPAYARSGSTPIAPCMLTVGTQSARYTLRATLLGAGSFAGDAHMMVCVSRKGAAKLPSAGVIRDRFNLTPREAEVAVLLAEGQSNGQIAEQLYLSPHTTRRHTANIFAKLEVSSRNALALMFLGG